MFGYVAVNPKELSEDELARYRAMYCGLCRTLKKRHGLLGPLTLSYDMTYLYVALSALYEPEERAEMGLCPAHPVKKRPYVINEAAEYCADMNVALFYHKCLDNWRDDRSLSGKAQARALAKAYARVEKMYPEKCGVIAGCLRQIEKIEAGGKMDIDGPCNLTGELLGEIYAWKDDVWQGLLRRMGQGVGRFIYLMDAYEDLPRDVRARRYNPLKELSQREDYQELCRQALTLFIAEGTDAFEILPIVKDAKLLRNVLYSGIWGRYRAIQSKIEKKESNHGRRSVSRSGRITKRNGG